MCNNLDRIRLVANYISASTSLADNNVVKLYKLNVLEKEITDFLSNYELTKDRELLRQSVLNTISDLRYLNGEEFRHKSSVLLGQVSLLLEIPTLE